MLFLPMFRALSLFIIISVWPAYGAQAFQCTAAKCGQLSDCSQATQELYVCDSTERDGDGDGIPCEQLCGRDGSAYREFLLKNFPNLVALFEKSIKEAAQLQERHAAPEANTDASNWKCGTKKRCREMTSCDEARFYLSKCGVRSLDGDRDGTPCNALCRGPR